MKYPLTIHFTSNVYIQITFLYSDYLSVTFNMDYRIHSVDGEHKMTSMLIELKQDFATE